MMDCLRAITRPLGVIAALVCALSLAGLGASRASPPAPSPAAKADEPPCNSICKAYMAWSSRVAATMHPSRPSRTTADLREALAAIVTDEGATELCAVLLLSAVLQLDGIVPIAPSLN